MIKTILFLVIAVPCSLFDIKKLRVPLIPVLAGIIAFSAFYLYLGCTRHALWAVVSNPLKASAVSLVLYVLALLLTSGSLGFTDVLFSIVAALYMGFPLVFFGTAFAALWGILFYLFVAVRRSFKKNGAVIYRPRFAIPYAPFISFGAVFSYVFFLYLR